ncbi:cytochrome c3 family protein [candidate division KSB1 bacterium]|nr:cytochrome c3 family protein [candidate division KSB1 bacterium]
MGKNGRSLFIDSTIFNSSIHGDFSCIDCHRDAEGEPHDKELLHVDCSFCHDDVKELYSTGIHGIALQNGDEDAPGCQNCHGSHNIFPSTYPASTTYFSTLQYTCGACHRAEGVAASHDIKIARPVEKYIRGIHSQAVEAGIDTAPTCNDCHESHDLLPSSDSRSRIHYTNISATCGRCHNDIQKDYESSSHGRALVQGSPEAPTCIHCHGEHDIQASYEPSAPISTKRLAQETCGPCHSKYNKLNKKYGLRRNPVESYYQSYHGLATAGGSINAAKCTSCHAKHKILPKTDPQSFIFPGNLEKTCGQCHEGSTENFSKSYIHTRPLSSEERLENIVKNVYIIIIVLVIGGMVVHNSIIMIYYIRQKYHMLKAARTIQRFNKQWIIQHILLIVTFFTLVFTGFGIKFADTAPMLFLTQLGIGVTVRGALHRIAAVILIGTGLYHLYYLFIHREGKGELNHLFFQKKDSLHLVENMKFFIQKSNKKPRFSRYGYIEKVEYWAMVWGTLIMAMTGAVLWFPEAATKFFPSWIIKVAETIHYWEAVLATLSIITYHFFFVIFHPEHYPLNLTFLTGNMTREQARSHFPDWDTKD